jgi:anti-sigma regulatory factor (Ser/Thr protein kinase)
MEDRSGPSRPIRRARAGFPADLLSAARARSFVGDLCRTWGVPGTALDAEMVVTELVENAVRHSRSDCDVSVALSDSTLTIGVGDHGPQPPRLLHPQPDHPGGRGLLMVQNLSRRWGYREAADGKVVWADLCVV